MSTSSQKRLVIACGGTGGHLFPGIAVAEEWTRRGGDVLLLISEKHIDALASEGYSHLRFEKMPTIAMPALVSLKMPGFLLRFSGAFFSCRKLLKSFRADAVLGMGGFTSTAPLIAGKTMGLPTFIHESNAIPGRANRLNAKFAHTILVGFERCVVPFGSGKPVEVVGTPLRPSLEEVVPREEAAKAFDLDPAKPTIMVMGGSQGARRLNELVSGSLAAFEEAGIQILQISGPNDYEAALPAYEEHPGAGKLIAFCSEMQKALVMADLAVCRSGASTLTELAHFGIPSVLVPYPFAADDHQSLNAAIFDDAGAAECWTQEELTEENFAIRMIELIQDREKMAQMGKEMKALSVPDASSKTCEVIVGKL
ncbi:MAG: undecaprenyldiphospho-muramoylpentapeptide beta-N-acetylglucosaminyltransferase [Verrucomicrobiota bacterium]